nr:hypothetical protein Iba_chr08fCG1860 [Ipomoea batatas]
MLLRLRRSTLGTEGDDAATSSQEGRTPSSLLCRRSPSSTPPAVKSQPGNPKCHSSDPETCWEFDDFYLIDEAGKRKTRTIEPPSLRTACAGREGREPAAATCRDYRCTSTLPSLFCSIAPSRKIRDQVRPSFGSATARRSSIVAAAVEEDTAWTALLSMIRYNTLRGDRRARRRTTALFKAHQEGRKEKDAGSESCSLYCEPRVVVAQRRRRG